MSAPSPLPSAEPLDPVDHIAVAAPDIAAAVDWYRQSFRCDVDYQDDTWALLRFANVKLALVSPDQHPAHLAIRRADAARFGRLDTHRDGSRSTYLEDLAGNAVEVIEPYESA